jgi:hypothetical protein
MFILGITAHIFSRVPARRDALSLPALSPSKCDARTRRYENELRTHKPRYNFPQMKHFRQWLFYVLATISLLLCFATVAMWIRSYWITGSMMVLTRQYTFGFGNGCGTFSVSCEHSLFIGVVHPLTIATSGWTYTKSNPKTLRRGPESIGSVVSKQVAPIFGIRHITSYDRYRDDMSRPPNIVANTLFGFHWQRSGSIYLGAPAEESYVLITPFWPFAGLFALLPAIFCGRMMRARRAIIMGRCPHCGYDLRATPNQCPECGTIPPSRGAIIPSQS